ncbi:MAG TPA: DNA-directed RNA polymerase subunit beta', partial [Planctomycetaceae bacterium]|nr:DNA-directed RNA polymerase subunit beta' [Planctomycetaceae bacterium]
NVEGAIREEREKATGHTLRVVARVKAEQRPEIVIYDADNPEKVLDVYHLPEGAFLEVQDGEAVKAGAILAKQPRKATGVTDIVGGLPRVTEILEARKPEDPAVLAEIDGIVEIDSGEQKRGKHAVKVTPIDGEGEPVVHWVPHGRRFLVHSGDHVQKGDRLVEGPLLPHDILRISGEAEVQEYLLREVQQVYRRQSVEINDKHIEIIVSQMSRRVEVTDSGDSEKLLPGQVLDRVEFRREIEQLKKCVKIKDPGDSEFQEGDLVPRDRVELHNEELKKAGQKPASTTKPKEPKSATRLFGITKAAVQSASFISAASFQETTKVLTEAALASKEDPLVGLKENVILGHLIPAGTGFRRLRDAEIRFLPEAMQKMAALGGDTETPEFRLLQGGDDGDGNGQATATAEDRSPSVSDSVGGSEE